MEKYKLKNWLKEYYSITHPKKIKTLPYKDDDIVMGLNGKLYRRIRNTDNSILTYIQLY